MGRGQKTKHTGTRELTETEPRASTETVPQTQFLFTSDPPEQGKMPADGVIAHEKEQKALKQEIARLREPQARSDKEVAKLCAQLAHTQQAFESLRERNSLPTPIWQFPVTSEPLGEILSQGLVF
jgi:septal ring factor EnvC (AmiA/AmiB activator)